MSLVDRGRELLEERLGVSLLSADEAVQLRESQAALYDIKDQVEDLGYMALSGGSARGKIEMRPESRVRMTQRARTSWAEDPITGTEAEHYANFSLGRGVGRPKAKDPEVQKVIDAAWTAAVNIETLIGYEAMRALSNELRAGCNVFLLGYEANGEVRVSFLEADTVTNVVTDEDNRFVPLWYVARANATRWDFANHRPMTPDVGAALASRYFAHWTFVDMMREERKRLGKKPMEEPAKGDLGEGVVYHARVNRLLEQQFGVPLGRRVLRFRAALTKMTEARVNMQLAASSFIAKRVVKGSGSDVAKAAEQLLQQTGAIGTGAAAARKGLTGLQQGPRPGAINVENESDTLQPLALNSGAAQANVDAMLVRGAAIAPTALGQHYFGSGDTSSLATAACHDEATETLTDEGWMTYEQLRERDAAGTLPKIAGFDTETRQVIYQRPLQPMLQYNYDGEMVAFANAKTDILVTPEHRMFVGRNGRWEFREARELLEPGPRGGAQRWDQLKAGKAVAGERAETFVLPSVPIYRRRRAARRLVEAETAQRIRIVAATAPSRAHAPPGYCDCGCGGQVPLNRRNRYRQSDGTFLLRKGESSRRLPGHPPPRPFSRNEIAQYAGATKRDVQMVLDPDYLRPRQRAYGPPLMRSAPEISMDAWLDWLGWYIAEGSGAEVAQSVGSPWLESLQDACRSLGVPAHESIVSPQCPPAKPMWRWRVCNPMQWQTWLHEHCGHGAERKHVPEFVFGLPAEQQMRVLRGLMHGDGKCGVDDTWERQGYSTFTSKSLQLVDDVQRLATNCGFRATRAASTALGTAAAVNLVATAERSPSRGWRGDCSRLPVPRRVAYRGRVYCFTLKTQTMVTRRNGHVSFNGNTLELPAMMAIGAWQETLEQILRWFTDFAIQAAVRAGKLGGASRKQPDDKALQELVLAEAEDHAAAERRTGKDLSYTLSMPYPGRRNLPDVMSAFTGVLTQLSPIGENPELTEIMLEWMFTHGLQLDDPVDAAKVVAATQTKLVQSQAQAQQQQQQQAADQQAQQQAQPQPPPQPGAQGSGKTPPGQQDTQQSQYGEKRKTAQPKPDGSMPPQKGSKGPKVTEGLPPELERLADLLVANAQRVLDHEVLEPALAAATNGNGSVGA